MKIYTHTLFFDLCRQKIHSGRKANINFNIPANIYMFKVAIETLEKGVK